MNALEGAAGVAPDLVVPLVGFRQWRLVDGELKSMYDDALWVDGAITAHCDRGHALAEVPVKDCTCGAYAYYDVVPLTASVATADLVAGAVVAWGRVEAHPYGMRSKHARIVALELPLSRKAKRRALLRVAERLEVPAVPHRSLKRTALQHGEVLRPALRPKKTVTRAANVWSR